jgi:hypothetical protein
MYVFNFIVTCFTVIPPCIPFVFSINIRQSVGSLGLLIVMLECVLVQQCVETKDPVRQVERVCLLKKQLRFYITMILVLNQSRIRFK